MHRRRHKRRPILDPKMEAVLARLIAESEGEELFKTQAVKLPYLVDVVASQILGQRITQGRYEAWDHGVVATEVYDLITDARHGGEALEGTPFEVAEPAGYEDRQIVHLGDGAPDRLTADEEEIVDFVALQYARLDSSTLGLLTKKMNGHVRSWPSSKPVRLHEAAYEHLPIKWGEVDLEIAHRRLEQIEREPERLVSGDDLDRELAEIFG